MARTIKAILWVAEGEKKNDERNVWDKDYSYKLNKGKD